MALDDLAATASAAPAVRRMRDFMGWVGPGGQLNQTGRIRPADAVALVELLGTGDVLDPRFPIRSSTELHWLSLWIGWAKACRLVRVVHGRIVPVRKNAALLDRPLAPGRETPDAIFALAQLGRVSGDRARDLDDALRARVLSRLGDLGAEEATLWPVREFHELETEQQGQALGDALPVGLRLLENVQGV